MVLFWVFVLAISILLYVLLDGFDLGVGILFGLARDESQRRTMMGAVSPGWDANETWLVAAAVVLWGAFPKAYAVLLSAFYLPVLLMVTALIARGVAFEFRKEAHRTRWLWTASFAAGSLVATFMQGVMIGALVEGLHFVNGSYQGGVLGWLSPFALLCGVGLCVGYALLGACWLVLKTEGDVRDFAYRFIPPLAFALLGFLIAVFAYALVEDLPVLGRWLARPYLFIFPVIGAAAAIVLATSVRRRRDRPPFFMAELTFAAGFATFAISFWPYMIPFEITAEQAASPHASLAFMFWGAGLFVFPMMLLYTKTGLRVFSGKMVSSEGQYEGAE